MRFLYKIKTYLERMFEMMAMLFAIRVVEGRTEFDKVPAKLKEQVAEIIITDFDLPELVPEEYLRAEN